MYIYAQLAVYPFGGYYLCLTQINPSPTLPPALSVVVPMRVIRRPALAPSPGLRSSLPSLLVAHMA